MELLMTESHMYLLDIRSSTSVTGQNNHRNMSSIVLNLLTKTAWKLKTPGGILVFRVLVQVWGWGDPSILQVWSIFFLMQHSRVICILGEPIPINSKMVMGLCLKMHIRISKYYVLGSWKNPKQLNPLHIISTPGRSQGLLYKHLRYWLSGSSFSSHSFTAPPRPNC